MINSSWLTVCAPVLDLVLEPWLLGRTVDSLVAKIQDRVEFCRFLTSNLAYISVARDGVPT